MFSNKLSSLEHLIHSSYRQLTVTSFLKGAVIFGKKCTASMTWYHNYLLNVEFLNEKTIKFKLLILWLLRVTSIEFLTSNIKVDKVDKGNDYQQQKPLIVNQFLFVGFLRNI